MRSEPNQNIELELAERGFLKVCGIDEAGRGALAGALVAGAVILPQKCKIKFADSKLLSRKDREDLARAIKRMFVWAVGIAEVREIDLNGIQSATYLTYHRAINSLKEKPDFLLIDHYRLPAVQIPQANITYGDRLTQAIAAASIIAKVTRDEIMSKLGKTDGLACYGFEKHFGYGTKIHLDAIKQYGLSSIHRKQFCKLDKDKNPCLFLDSRPSKR